MLAAHGAGESEPAAEISALHTFSLFAQGQRAAARTAIDVLLRDHPDDLDDRLRRIHHAVGIFQRLGFAHAALDVIVWPCVLK